MTNAIGKTTPITGFSGDLAEVRGILERTALDSRGRWARLRLTKRGGIVVSMRASRKRVGLLQLAIARDSTPDSLTEQSRWEAEVRLVQVALLADGWHRGDDVFNVDAIAAVFSNQKLGDDA